MDTLMQAIEEVFHWKYIVTNRLCYPAKTLPAMWWVLTRSNVVTGYQDKIALIDSWKLTTGICITDSGVIEM